MSKITAASRKMRSLNTACILASLDGNTTKFVLFTYDPNRIAFGGEEFLGLTVEEALGRAKTKASLLLQDDAITIAT